MVVSEQDTRCGDVHDLDASIGQGMQEHRRVEIIAESVGDFDECVGESGCDHTYCPHSSFVEELVRRQDHQPERAEQRP